MLLSELSPDTVIDNLVRNQTVTILMVSPIGAKGAKVLFRFPDERVDERVFFEDDFRRASVIEQGRQLHLTTDAEDFKLAAEAYRIKLGFLFDPMMAVHTSDVIPLPHQISAVYESMLPRQPLRYVLADDPGAGKTIMAGLLINELMLRSDAERVLIIAPGSLVEQWQDELYTKFGMSSRFLRVPCSAAESRIRSSATHTSSLASTNSSAPSRPMMRTRTLTKTSSAKPLGT